MRTLARRRPRESKRALAAGLACLRGRALVGTDKSGESAVEADRREGEG